MSCFPAQLQAPAKSFLRPSTWMPGARNNHVCNQSWKLEADPEQCIDELMRSVERLNESEHPHEYYVNKVRYQDHWIQIYSYTPAGWLDVVEISIVSSGTDKSLAKLLCWCPFSDGGLNEFRCKILRESLPFQVTLLFENDTDMLLPKEHEDSTIQYTRLDHPCVSETQKNK